MTTAVTEVPLWRAYLVQQTDAFGYDRERWGVREEYRDGSTRYIHNQVLEDREQAEKLAAQFNFNVRKGKQYDNAMKTWR